MSENEKVLVQEWYHKKRFPLELINCSIAEVELWMQGETTGGKKARANKTHYKQLYASWVLEKAFKRLDLKSRSNGHRPKKSSHLNEAEKKKEFFDNFISKLHGGKTDDTGTNDSAVEVDFELMDKPESH